MRFIDKISVLYLDDSSEKIRIVQNKLIGELNCRVHIDIAKSENAFIKHLNNNRYDVVLSNYSTNGFDAYSALKKVQQLCPNTPFICVADYIGEEHAVKMLKQGAADYISKKRINRISCAVLRAIEKAKTEHQKQRAEMQLKLANERYRLILDSTSDAIGMFDKDGTILSINSNFADKLGTTVEYATGKNIKSLLSKERYNKIYAHRLERVQRVLHTGQSENFEYYIDGAWVSTKMYPVIADGQISYLAMFSSDITDRKNAEEEARRNAELKKEAEVLRQNEEEYLEILDGFAEGCYIVDLQKRTIEYSAQWIKRMGAQNIPTVQLIDFVDALIHPEDRQRVLKHRQDIFERKKQKCKIEYRMKTVDSGYIWVLSQGKVTYDQNGCPYKVYGATIDITDRKLAEQRLRKTAEELEQKNKLITDFFVNLSHEFRTPISVLLLAIEITEQQLKHEKPDLASISSKTAMIKQNVLRLSKMANNFLDIAKIDAGFFKPKWETIDIVCFIKQLIASVRGFTTYKGIKIAYSSNVQSLFLSSDPLLLERIILNLLSNAIKNSPKGAQIKVKCYRSQSHVVLSVKDSGEGIPEDKTDVVFDRFLQVDNSLTRKNEGCGIGLALSKSLVALLGGHIWFQSELQKGSEFFVKLPVIEKLPTKVAETYSLDVESRILMEFSDIH